VASAGSGKLNYAWSVARTRAGVTTTFASGAAATFKFTPSDDGLYTVYLTVRRNNVTVGSDIKSISVLNVAPTATFSAPASVRVNRNFTLSLKSVSDPSSIDRSSGFVYAFDCGDGQGLRPSLTASYSCKAPATTRTITVQASLTDKDGASRLYSLNLSVTP
jgi:hypothetical protein